MKSCAAAIFAAAPSFAQDTAWVDDARKVAGSVPPKLLTVLKTEIDKGGPEGAIEVCRDKAPAMAKAASEETGWAIRRVSERGKQVRRYMRAVATQELCMNCHGPVDKMTPAVIAKLKALYPEDRGTGYTVGQIRGAMTIRKAM
mgnify:CR=1 FL=1